MFLKIFDQALQEIVTANCLCVADKATLSSSTSDGYIHSPLVAKKTNLNSVIRN